MPKPRKRKNSEFQTTLTKSVFLFGNPNKAKCLALQQIQDSFTELVNQDIQILNEDRSVLLQIIKNDKKDPDMRWLEKSLRPSGINSAFCQNAFDMAVTHLSNRMDNIRKDLMQENTGIFSRSKVLFAMSILQYGKKDMIAMMQSLPQKFHKECAEELMQMSSEEFCFRQTEFLEKYQSVNLEYQIPVLRNCSVPLDSRLMRIETSNHTIMPYVIFVSDPFHPGKRIQIPINTSRHSLHKIQTNHMAGTVMMQIRNNVLRIGWSYDVKRRQPETITYTGVDTGITDSFYTSDGRAIGSMSDVIGFYHREVEPAFATLSDLRNKKRAIRHYLKKHDVPEDVRRSLIKKIDRLEHMIRTMDMPYRKKRHYYNLLDQEIKNSVKAYMKDLRPDTLTVVEKLDIKEFRKSRHTNGMFSVFARGKLQKTLLSTLNWKGYDFLEVVPDFTSQVCPVCQNLDPKNREHKTFFCTCCGYEDDADHVGSLNIRTRATDQEILDLCQKYQYKHKELQRAMKIVYAGRNQTYRRAASA